VFVVLFVCSGMSMLLCSMGVVVWRRLSVL